MKEQKRKIVRSVSAFAFALSLFAAGSGTQVSASEIDPSIAGASIASSYDEETDSDAADGQTAEDTNDDNAEDITTTYSQGRQSEDEVEAEPEEGISSTTEDEQGDVEPTAPESTEAPVLDAQGSPSPDTEVNETTVNESASVQEESSDAETASENTQETETDEAATAATVSGLLNAANGYNVFIEGNYTQYGAGGNVDMGDGSAVVAVGGNMNFGNTVAGSIEVGGSINGSTNSPAVSGEDCTIDFESAFNNLRETSSSLTSYEGVRIDSSDPNNYIRNEYGTVTFKGDNADLNVFTMTVEEYNALVGSESHSINYDVPDGSTVLLNIVGEGDLNLVAGWGASFGGNQLTSGNGKNSQVLVNVPNASNVKIGCSVGALLAPNSHITSNGDVQHYEGQVIGKSFEGSIEFGSTSFNGNITPNKPDTPDPDPNPDPDKPEVPDTPDPTPDPDPEPSGEEDNEDPEDPDDENDDTPDEEEDDTPETPDNEDDDTPDEEEDDTPEDPDDEDDDTPDEEEDDTPEDPDDEDDDTPDEEEDDTPEDPDDEDDDTPDEEEDDTPETPDDGPDTPETPDEGDETPDPTPDPEPDIPEVPDTPDPTPDIPNKPDVPTTPDRPYSPENPLDDPIVPITDFELADEPEIPEDVESAEVETLDEQSNDVEDKPSADLVTFEDSPVPLSDSPFSDSDTETDIETAKNPTTGNKNKMVAPAMTALAAMTVLLEELNRKKRTE